VGGARGEGGSGYTAGLGEEAVDGVVADDPRPHYVLDERVMSAS